MDSHIHITLVALVLFMAIQYITTVVIAAQQFAIGYLYGAMKMMFVIINDGNEPRECSIWMYERACGYMER